MKAPKTAATFGVFALIGLSLPGSSFAQPIKQDYELQERCAKRAEEFFDRKYGGESHKTDHGSLQRFYSNHYNRKLNKCFIEMNLTEIYNGAKGLFIRIMDVNENISYASFAQFKSEEIKDGDCVVYGKSCHSKEEWDLLIATYMED